MGFRYRKSFGKGPFRVNLSKSGIGYSVGIKGFRYTKKAGGGTRTTVSIPGTGISYVSETSKKSNNKKRGSTVKQSGKSARNNPVSPNSSPKVLSEIFHVTSVSSYADSLKSLIRLNPDWDLSPEEIYTSDRIGQKIYKYRFTTSPVELIPELGNTHDPHAVKVMIAGSHVGYVPKDNSILVNTILRKYEVKSIACGIIGGPYKVIDEAMDTKTDKSNISITVKITYYEPAAQTTISNSSNPQRITFIELMLCWLFGYLGVHKFYRKKKGLGFLYLLTIGLFGIGWIGDSIYYTIRFISNFTGSAPTRNQKYSSYAITALCLFILGSCGNNGESATVASGPVATETQFISTESYTNIAIVSSTDTTMPETFPPTTEPPIIETTAPIVETTFPTVETTVATEPIETKAAQITFITWPQTISRNQTGTVTIQGEPNTNYSITVRYKSGPSEADGLEDKTSNANGMVSWSWKVGPRTSAGTYSITVRGGGVSQTVDYTIVE